MNILTVIPLAKGIPRDELSYFSAREVAVGMIVTVPFGGRSIKSVVIDARPVRDLKAGIKGASFQLKNIIEMHSEGLPYRLFAAAQATAHYYAQPVGAVVETMIPKALFDYYLSHERASSPAPATLPDLQLLQVASVERVSLYKTLVRENFAKTASTLIVVPTVIQTDRLATILRTGIEEKIVTLHGKLSKKKMTDAIHRACSGTDPIVLIATAPFASIARNDWDTVIIEESGSPHYRYGFGPRFDMRHFIERAHARARRIIHADTLIETDLRARYERREISELRATWHIAKPDYFQVVNQRPEPDQTTSVVITAKESRTTRQGFQLFSDEALAMIGAAIQQRSKIALVATRKGLAPLTVCSDCGTVVTCPNCATPLVLHRAKKTGGRVYLCHHCLHTTTPIDHCVHCFGSRLALLGISTDRIADEVTERFGDFPIFVTGEDEATTARVMKEWRASASGILIGTHGLLPYLDSVPYTIIVSMDSLLSLPSYTSAEESLRVILSFLEKTAAGAILQTRNIAHDAVRAVQDENLFDFMRNELASRAQFGYPPSKILLKISFEGKESVMNDATSYLDKILAPFDPDIMMKKSKKPGFMILQAFMKIDPSAWNHPESPIQTVIQALPREFSREVNPDSVI